MLRKKSHGALPRQLGGSGVKTRGGVVVKTVLSACVAVRGVACASGFQCGLIRGPSGVDAFVHPSKMDQQGCFDFSCILRRRVVALEGHSGGQIRQARGKRVRHAAAIAKSDDTDFSVAVGTGF